MTGPAERALRVAHLLAPVGFGGGERLLAELIAAQPPHQSSVVVTLQRSEALAAAVTAAGGTCVSLFDRPAEVTTSKRTVLRRLPATSTSLLRLRRTLADHDVDVLHAHGFPPALLGAIVPGPKARIYTHHYERRPPVAAERQILRAVYRRYDLCTTPAPHLTDLMRGAFGIGFETVPNAVAPSFFEPAVSSAGWRERLAIAPTAPFLVGAGRLIELKGFHHVVAALPKLPDVHLALAGDGPERTALVELARGLGVRDRLHLVGALAPDEMPGLYQAADVYVHPSRTEAMSVAVLEAQAAGALVVATDIPAMREQVGEDGVLVADGDFAAGIRRALSADAGLAARARARAAEHRSDVISARWTARYDELRRSARRRP